MKTKENQLKANLIINFYSDNNNDRKLTVKHFLEQKIPRRTIDRTLKRYLERGSVDYIMNGGRKRTVLTNKTKNKIRKKFVSKPAISNRKASKEMNIPESTIRKAKKKLNITTRKKKTAPKYNEDQEKRSKTNALKLYRKFLDSRNNLIFVLDDETYCAVDPSQLPGDKYYNKVEGVEINVDATIKSKSKYFKKYLVWQAIASNSMVSDSFISTGTMNGEKYLKECVPRLIKFINSLNSSNNVLFWPDMATCHYYHKVKMALENANIDYVKKSENLPNCPQLRPIERYWALSKSLYQQYETPSSSLRSFKARWNVISKNFSVNSIKNLFNSFTSNLYEVGQNGVRSVL